MVSSVFTFNTQAYKIVSSEANTLNITGSPVDIPNTLVMLVLDGIGCLISLVFQLIPYTALYSLDLADLDFLKSQDASAIYYEGFGFLAKYPNVTLVKGIYCS